MLQVLTNGLLVHVPARLLLLRKKNQIQETPVLQLKIHHQQG